MPTLKEIIYDKKVALKFEEETHRYYLQNEPDIEFVSCTTFIEYFFQKFDSIGIANNLCLNNPNYEGIFPQSLVKSWEETANYGTLVHKEIEKYIESGLPPKEKRSQDAINWLNSIDINNCDILSEARVYSKELRIAGTIDLIIQNKVTGIVDIYDWKTTKSVELTSYGNRKGRKPVTENLPDCNYFHYSLQLSLYKYILENYYNITVNTINILHLDGNSVIKYRCEYMVNEIEEMLKYDRKVLAKETEDGLTKEFINYFDFDDFEEPDFEDIVEEDFEIPDE